MNKKTLIGSQVTIILWQLFAAVSAIEAYNQFLKNGFSNWKFYFFVLLFITCVVMFFIKRKSRSLTKN